MGRRGKPFCLALVRVLLKLFFILSFPDHNMTTKSSLPRPKRHLCAALATLLGVFLITRTARAGGPYIFLMSFGDTGAGMTADRVKGIFDQLFMTVEKKTSIKIKGEIIPSANNKHYSFIIDDILARMKVGKGQVTLLSPGEYHRAGRRGHQVKLWMSMTVNMQKLSQFCVYTKAGGPIKSLKDLKGKAFAGMDEYVAVRTLFAKEGVNEPLWKFFGSIPLKDSSSENFEAILSGKLAGMAQSAFGYKFLVQQNPKFKGVRPFKCLDQYPNQLIVTVPSVNPADSNTLTSVLVNAHRDPEFRSAKWFFLAINGAFFPADASLLAGFQQLMKDATAKGYVKEEDEWFTKVLPVMYKQQK